MFLMILSLELQVSEVVLQTERKEMPTLQLQLRVSWLCLSFAILVGLNMLVVYILLLLFLHCA